MAGDVPFIIPRPQFLVPAAPVVQRLPLLAWNATSKPPPASFAIEGDVPGIIPSLRSPDPPASMFHKLFVLASKAVENVTPDPDPAPSRRWMYPGTDEAGIHPEDV